MTANDSQETRIPTPGSKTAPLGSSDLNREEERFEIAVGNFMRSCIDLQANEAAFQAW